MHQKSHRDFTLKIDAVESFPGSGFFHPSLLAVSRGRCITRRNVMWIQNMTESSVDHARTLAAQWLAHVVGLDCDGKVEPGPGA